MINADPRSDISCAAGQILNKLTTVKGLQQDIEVTVEMKDAGASVIEKYPSGKYDPFFVAEEVFRAMIARLAHQPTQ